MGENTSPNRAAEIMRIIDERLLAEEVVLEGLRQAVARNALAQDDADYYFNEYQRAFHFPWPLESADEAD